MSATTNMVSAIAQRNLEIEDRRRQMKVNGGKELAGESTETLRAAEADGVSSLPSAPNPDDLKRPCWAAVAATDCIDPKACDDAECHLLADDLAARARDVRDKGTPAREQIAAFLAEHEAANPVVGCSVDRPLRLRPITDADVTAASNEGYQHGRKHGKEELADEIETLIYWLLRCYQSGHREGWEKGPTTQETMDALLHVLAERGYDPNLDAAAKELIDRVEKYQ